MNETKETPQSMYALVVAILSLFLSIGVIFAAQQFLSGNTERAWFILAMVALIRLDIIAGKIGRGK